MVYAKRSFSSVDRGEHHGSIDNSITYASVVKGEKTPNKKYSAAFVDNDVRTEFPSLGVATGDLGDGFILVTKRTRRKQGRKVGHRTTKGGTFPGKGRRTFQSKSTTGTVGSLAFKKKNRLEHREVNATRSKVGQVVAKDGQTRDVFQAPTEEG